MGQLIGPVLLARQLRTRRPSGNPCSTAASRDEVDDQHDDADEEQDPGDLRGNRSYPEETEGTGDQPHYQEHQRVIEHWFSSLRWTSATAVPASQMSGNARELGLIQMRASWTLTVRRSNSNPRAVPRDFGRVPPRRSRGTVARL